MAKTEFLSAGIFKLSLIILIASFHFGCSKGEKTEPQTKSGDNHTKHEDTSNAVMTRERQNLLAVDNIIQQFKDGNVRFLEHKSTQKDFLSQVEQTGNEGQFPKAILLSCIDSRAPAEIIFDKGIGDIFGTRVAGNYADSGIIGGIEYATFVSGAKLIIVMGHTDCGAIKSACDHVMLGNITKVMDELKPAVDSVKGYDQDRTSRNTDFVKAVTKENVRLTMEKIKEGSEIITSLIFEGKLKLLGAIYDVKTGKVEFLE